MLGYLLLAAVLCTACQPAATSQGGTTTTTAGSTGHYFKADPANGEAYNAAITAYDTFLSGNQPAAGSTGVSEIYIGQLTTVNGTDGIDAFGLWDVNGDGIPELHTRSTHLDVFTFKNGKVVHLLTSPFSYLNATVKVTADGTVFGKQDGTGTFYFVTRYVDGAPLTLRFSCLETAEVSDYSVDGTAMEKDAWEAATAVSCAVCC
jgi:hypothetical protein